MSGMPLFDWLRDGNPDEDEPQVYVSITPVPEYAPGRMHWEVVHETDRLGGFERAVYLDDDAVSAWSEVARVMCENGATPEQTDEMVAAAPDNLGWCFDGQVGMYAYDENEEQDG